MRKLRLFVVFAVLLLLSTFLASCGRVNFKVEFIVDNEVYDTLYTNGESTIKMPTDPTKAGFAFDGWYWDNDLWQRRFTANSLLNEPLSANVKVYAKWNDLTVKPIVVAQPTYSGGTLTYGDSLPTISTTTAGGSIALNAGQILTPGTKDYNWTFTPLSTTNHTFTNTTGTISLTVHKATVAVPSGTTLSITSNSITQVTVMDLGSEYEYSKNNETWQNSNVFGGLTENTTYTFYARLKETDNFKPSIAISATTTTDKDSGHSILSADGFTITESSLSTKVANATATFSFINKITVSTGATWQVSTDINGTNVISTKTISLAVGDNTVYLLVKAQNGTDMSTYAVTVRRRPNYRVIYKNEDSSFFTTQLVEEDDFAIAPTNTPMRSGYNFKEWAFNFDTPITNNIFIEPTWEAITYSITYINLLDGTNPNASITEYTIETETIIFTAPSRMGYIGSWDIASIIKGSYGNKIITAQWEVLPLLKDFDFTSTATSLTIIKYYGNSNEVVIPNIVTAIGSGVFRNCYNLSKITLPNSITSIGEDAFYNCYSLSEITLPSSLTSIGSGVFRNCTSLSEITLPSSLTSIGSGVFRNCTSLSEITLPNSITSIGEDAFYNCTGLKSVTLPSSLTSIGSSAFNRCIGLSEITLPNSITSIGEEAFQYCSSLSKIILPNSITSIGEEAFQYCSSLSEITLPSSVTSIKHNAFSGCTGLTSFTIPNSVTSIKYNAFSGCSSLTEFVVAIGNKAFATENGVLFNKDKKQLLIYPSGKKEASYTIPNRVTAIDFAAFSGCTNLSELTLPFVGRSLYDTSYSHFGYIFGAYTYSDQNTYIPQTLKTVIITGSNAIGSGAFFGCRGLTTIKIYGGVTSIENNAFLGCSSLAEFVVSPENKAYSAENGVLFNKDKTKLFIYPNGKKDAFYTIPNSVTAIEYAAFYGCTDLSELTLPFVGDTLNDPRETHFGHIFGAFSYSDQNTYIPQSLKTVIITGGNAIGSGAFSGCSSLSEIIIPNGVTSIGYSAFSGCTGLSEITLPSSVTSIGSCAFTNCTGLSGITFPSSVTTIGEEAFYGCTSLTSIIIPNGVTSIGKSAFSGCTGLTSVTLSNSVTTIGDYSFQGCTGLTTVTIGNGVTSIGYRAFYGCISLKSLTIGNGVTTIGNDAFFGCTDLTSITIANSVTTIGEQAFKGCTSLTSIIIPDGVTSIGNSAFYGCISLKSVTIPNSVTFIGDGAFDECPGLGFEIYNGNLRYLNNVLIGVTSTSITSATLKPTTTVIGIRAFMDCTGLNSVTIPSSVTSIGEYAFKGCTGFTSVVIPNSVTAIGKGAFSGCRGLTSITLPFVGNSLNGTSNTHFGYIFGASYFSQQNAYVPKTLKNVLITGGNSIGDSAFYGCTILTTITIPNSVTFIGDSAFYGCSDLKNFTIPNSVIFVGDSAFKGCSDLDYEIYSGNLRYLNNALIGVTSTSITSATLKPTTTVISNSAFYNCTGLSEITIPNSITSIGNNAFKGCSSLTTITIPSNVTAIGKSAFEGCSSLTTVTIPSSVTAIGKSAFYGCINIESITLPFVGDTLNAPSNTHFGYIFGSFSFSNQNSYIPQSLKTVIVTGGNSFGSYAFADCTSLTSITIPESVTSIGNYAFYGCYGLTSITIPSRVTSIGGRAFESCTGLSQITLPSSVTSIGNGAFSNCTKLRAIYYMGTKTQWSAISIDISNDILTSVTRYYYSSTPIYDYQHWRYVDGVPTLWIRGQL